MCFGPDAQVGNGDSPLSAYTIHQLRNAPAEPLARADNIRFVKEGMAWWALVVPLLWLFYQRMWLVLAGYVAAMIAMQFLFVVTGLGETAFGWSSVVFTLVFVIFANDLRRWSLARGGYITLGAVTGRSLNECEIKYFSQWEDEDFDLEEEVTASQDHPALINPKLEQARAALGGSRGDDVIGLFPDADR